MHAWSQVQELHHVGYLTAIFNKHRSKHNSAGNNFKVRGKQVYRLRVDSIDGWGLPFIHMPTRNTLIQMAFNVSDFGTTYMYSFWYHIVVSWI